MLKIPGNNIWSPVKRNVSHHFTVSLHCYAGVFWSYGLLQHSGWQRENVPISSSLAQNSENCTQTGFIFPGPASLLYLVYVPASHNKDEVQQEQGVMILVQ
jgi:hypothetical protein